ncbi:MAG: hypothetical protein HQL66_14070, partial [Magnetococcales bacterium]|nr:hypothetical protein [Magnetococcales bacterium]
MGVVVGFLLLAGCSGGEAPTVDAHLYAQDGVLDTLQRLFLPRSYWTRRVEQLQRAVEEAHAEFDKQHAAYRQLLARRRHMALAGG